MHRIDDFVDLKEVGGLAVHTLERGGRRKKLTGALEKLDNLLFFNH